MSRVIVNSGHAVAKLSFSDERHVNRCATTCTHKIGKKERKKEINFICRELFHCIYTKTISIFTHDNKNVAIDLFILQDLFYHIHVAKLIKTSFPPLSLPPPLSLSLFLYPSLSLFIDFRIIITTYVKLLMKKIWRLKIATRNKKIAKIQWKLSRVKSRDQFSKRTFAETQPTANPISQRASRPTCRR